MCACFVWFSELLSSTGPGWFYSRRTVSPPVLGDIRRASSLTYRRCVGLKEKPPRRGQNKSSHPHKMFRLKAKRTVFRLFVLYINIHLFPGSVWDEITSFINILLTTNNVVFLFWRQVPDMAVLSVFYLKLRLCSRHHHPEMWECFKLSASCKTARKLALGHLSGHYYQ